METLLLFVLMAIAVLVGLSLGLYAAAKPLARREPYRSFLGLPLARKARFFKALLRHPQVPWFVKVLPLLLVLYLASPLDIIPDFLPGIGYLDDVGMVLLTLALVLRLTPGEVVRSLLRDVQENGDGRQRR